VEDEPELLYEQLVAAGVHPGMQIQLLESGKRIRIWTRNGEQILAPPLAALVSVVPLAEETDSTSHGELLADLKPGEKAVVTAISPACRKQERRRLMDLGILPGTTIEAVMRSPAGDPTAYRVRGTLIALRKEQSRTIYISRGAQEAA
jgi:DtxR family Mn-dependent transcriptional regulator